MSSRVRKAALWAAVLVAGAGLLVLWAERSAPGDEEITAVGSALSGAADALAESGAAPGGAAEVAPPLQEMSQRELLTATAGSGDGDPLGAGAAVLRAVGGQDEVGAAADGTPGVPAQGPADSADDSEGVMVVSQAAAVSGCAGLFDSPGEQLTLAAVGFAGGATVSLTVHSASLGDATVSASVLADAMADADGVIEVSWSVPSAPAASVDAVPRGYAVVASGANSAGGMHTARLVSPVVVYPGTSPCAVADTASTTLGTAVQVAVLGNDIAPAGGSLDAASVSVRPSVGGAFEVNEATGVMTFTPDVGFWGTVKTTYVVFDGWGIGVQADLSVTVDAGCTITGTEDDEVIEGTEGNDVLCVPDRDDWRAFHIMDGKGGDDVILGGAGEEWIYGGAGADVVYANGGDDQIVAGAGVDTVYGGPGMDLVHSVDFADSVIDDDFELVVSPAVIVEQTGPRAEGDWVWVESAGAVEIDVLGNDHDPNGDLVAGSLRVTTPPTLGTAVVGRAADGRAVVSYLALAVSGLDSVGYEVCDALGSCAAGEVTVMVGTALCTVVGTAGDDTLRGTPGEDVICGLGGDDTIRGIGGDDVIVGGPGDDDINAGAGDDIVWGGGGADTLDGGPGADAVWGAAGDDTLVANPDADRLDGGLGDDTITGGGGNDLIWGGPGDDTLDGHAGDDTVWGGPGTDTIRGGLGDDTIWGGLDADTITGNAGADNLHGGLGDDRLDGSTQNDTLWGGPGDDILDGQGHDDELHGGPGADTLRGGSNDDRLWGGLDADTLDGGNGVDHLDGGPDTDTCTRAASTAYCE